MNKLFLFTDGGGDKESTAGAACILRTNTVEKRIIAILGGATNNEAEITAMLVGLAATSDFDSGIRWLSDSEYALKSASSYIKNWQKNGWKTASKQPVKNLGLWKCYLELSKNLNIEFEHVKGHSGHTENEFCDSASTWARMNSNHPTGTINFEGYDCLLLNLESFIQGCRAGFSELEMSEMLKKTLSTDIPSLKPKPIYIQTLEKAASEAKQAGQEDLAKNILKLLPL